MFSCANWNSDWHLLISTLMMGANRVCTVTVITGPNWEKLERKDFAIHFHAPQILRKSSQRSHSTIWLTILLKLSEVRRSPRNCVLISVVRENCTKFSVNCYLNFGVSCKQRQKSMFSFNFALIVVVTPCSSFLWDQKRIEFDLFIYTYTYISM